MKNGFIRMETRAAGSGARVMGKRTLAIVLCFVMLLTAIGSGSVLSAVAVAFEGSGAGVLAQAAKAGAEAADITLSDDTPAAAEVSDTSEPFVDDIEDGFVVSKKADADLADTGYGSVYLYYTTSTSGTWNSATMVSFGSGGSGSQSVSLAENTTYRFIVTGGTSNADWFGNNTFDLSSQTTKTNYLGKYYNFYASSTRIENSPNKLITSSAGSYTFNVNLDTGSCTVSGGTGSSGGGGGGGGTVSSKVYFVKPADWTDVYAYFYNSSGYWDNTNGSGSSKSSANLLNSGDDKPGVQMTTTTIDGVTYYVADCPANTAKISFVKDKQDDYGHFWETEAVYASFDGTTPIITPTSTHETKNETKYYEYTSSALPALTTPTITVDGQSSASSVTASTTANSTVLVTNVNSYAEGTVFKLYHTSGGTTELVDSNTSGSFTVSRNTGTAGTYKVVAVPGAEDTTHSNSEDSNTPTLTVTKVAAPAANPIITLDKNETVKDGKVVLTVTNAASFDSDIYDLYFYKVKDGSATKEAPFEGVDHQPLTTNPLINVVQSGAVTAGENDHAHYYVVAEAKDDTVYTDSGYSNVENVWIQIPRYWFTGGLGDGTTWGTGDQSGKNKAADQYFGDNTFYHKYTGLSGDKYFRIVSNSTEYGTDSTKDDVAVGDYTASNYMYDTVAGDTKAMTMNFDSTKSYYMFVHQRTGGLSPQFYYRTDLSDITITKKYITYNLANDTFGSPATTANDSYVSINTESTFVVVDDAEFTVIATVTNSDYEFLGWYSSATISDANLITTSPSLRVEDGVKSDTTYYPVVRQKVPNKYSVIVEDNDTASVSATWNSRTAKNGRKLTNVPAGASVTLTATAKDGYSIDKISWKSADGDSGTVTSGSTFTMPDSTVTVTVTTKPDKYFWYHKGVSDTTKNEEVTPVVGSNTGKDTWTYDSKIDVDKIKGIYTAKIPAYYFNSTNYSTFCFSDSKDAVLNQMYYRSSSDNDITVDYGDDTSSGYITAYKHKYTVEYAEYNDLTDRNYYYAKVKFNNADALANANYVLMQADTSNRKYTFTLVSSDNPKSYNFVAKDGPAAKTTRTDDNKYYDSIGKAGDFYVKKQDGSANIGTVDSSTYSAVGVQTQTGVMKQGTTYQFCCVIKDPRYYVKAFNVNGISVCVFDKPASRHSVDDIVVGYYTVPDDAGDEFEIEPVFYHYDDSDCVTFYLESYDSVIQDNVGWGHTPYIYPFYATVTGATSGGADAARNAYGAYPGTAMVFENGLYEIQLPVTNIDLVGSISGGATEDGANIKGITINNGYYDLIHRAEMGWSNSDDQYHMQTYDFDDFHKIYEEKNPTNIYFKIKLREDRDNSKEYRHTLDTTLSSADLSDIRDNGNGWELLQDRHNRTIDIFGTPLTSEQAALDPLYVISTGYVANTAGSYGTAWQIYSKTGNSYTLVTATNDGTTVNSIPPSLLFVNTYQNLAKEVYPTNNYTGNKVGDLTINPGTLGDPETYTTLYNTLKTTTYSGRPVMLSYEMNDRHTKSNYGGSGEDVSGAWRLDGRWYYTTAGDNIKSTIEIEYLDGAAGYVAEKSYVTGYDGEVNQGAHTGANAFFTDTDYKYYAKRETGDVILDKTKTFNMTAQAADGYEFEGWYIKSDSSYIPMNATDLKKTTATVQRSAGQTFVARYKKLTTGKLSITNTATTGTAIDGNTYSGAGTAALTVEITENNGGNWKTLATGVTSYTLGAEYLNDEKLGNNEMKLKITASGTASGSDGFGTIDNVYTNRSQENNTAYTIQLNKLFTSTEVDGNTVYEQQTFSLPFKTYFVAHTYQYNITYTYPSTRLNATQTYTATGSIKSSQVASVTTGGVLTNAFIEGKKPTESNFMKQMDFMVDTSTSSTDGTGTVTTYTATAHYSINDAQSGKVSVMLDLPYAVSSRTVGSYNFTAVDGEGAVSASPAYNTTFAKIPLKDLAQGYGGYLSNTGTVISTTDGLLTAPASVVKNAGTESEVTKYFSYWNVTNLDGVEEFRCYNLEFNYRLYDNYIITPVFNNDVGGQNIGNAVEYKGATISYAGTTRNQWNNNGCGDYTAGTDAQNKASDILFNDFEVAYNYADTELKNDTNATCGVILQKLGTIEEDASGAKITDVAYYQTKYAGSVETDSATIEAFIGDNAKRGLTLQKYDNLRTNLNNKNRMDFYYATYNSYGWNDETNGPETSRAVKQNVYRAYAYMTYSDDTTTYLSAPVYFTMYEVATS